MSREYAKPTPQARQFSIAGARKDGKRYGRLTPRMCDPAVIGAAAERYERRCFRCDRPLARHEGPVCCPRETPR